MSAAPSGLHALVARLGRLAARVRPVHGLAAAGAVVVVGMVGLQAVALPAPRPLTEGERLRIEVVHPVEPDIVAGSVMDVGELVDGFQGVPRAPVVETVAYAPWDDWGDEPAPPPPPRRHVEFAEITAPPQPAEPSTDRHVRDRWFGFDAPRQDYRAEREARRARIEARIEQERERDGPRRYRSDAGRERGHDRDRVDADRGREPPSPRDEVPPPDRWD